jgi:hypothetical protein
MFLVLCLAASTLLDIIRAIGVLALPASRPDSKMKSKHVSFFNFVFHLLPHSMNTLYQKACGLSRSFYSICFRVRAKEAQEGSGK